ncbi:MAG: DUF2298 domain-containing protein, partial [Chloroflexota bacterium]|nr:DUF2298 domain-containing protein [Chloroflexota bacterium]
MPQARRLARRLPSAPTTLALLALLLAAFGLRVFGLDWDDGQYLHPDERHVVDVLAGRIELTWPPPVDELLDPATSGLNPRSADPETGEFRSFAYGALPLLVTDAMAAMVGVWSARDWDAYGSAHLIGRTLSALFDTATVLVVYATGTHLFSRRVGLLGAALAALAPMSIQLAHFFTTDSWLTFVVALCLLAAVRAAETDLVRWYAAVGASFGLAMATKGSVFALAGIVVAAVAYGWWQRRAEQTTTAAARVALGQLAVAGLAAVVVFGVFEPYALIRPDVYLRSLSEQAAIVGGRLDVPYTRQYVGTMPVLYQAEQFVRWGFGPVAGALAIAGAGLLVVRFWRERTAGGWILLAWLGGYGLVVAVAEAKFLRYLAPLVPVLAIMAGLALDTVWRWSERRGGRAAGVAVAALLLAGAALWTTGFSSIYAHENTRLAASRWLLANVPSGSTLSDDYWDDALPASLMLGLSGNERQYETFTIDLYADREPAEVADELYRMLERVDYVVQSSNRVAAAMPRSPWRYPVQARYFQLLREGRLGFGLATEFARPPSIGGLRFVDHDADESFVNYDHPRVLIYRKEALPSRPEFDRLMAWALERPWSATRQAPERASLLLDEPVGDLTVVGDARWSERLTGRSLGALVVWLGLLGLLQVAGWPLASLVFGRFADAGWGFARLLSLLVAGYLVWIGASTRLIAFRAAWAAAALALVGGVGWALWLRRRRGWRVWRFEPSQRRAAVGAEIVFWSVFALFLLFRYLNPDSWHPIWGGEKPMEFAHLNATLRSAHFPPYDPWYADGYLNYYYYGLYLVAFCLKLTGIPSEIGFNLAQPTVVALLASAGYALAAALARDVVRRPWAAIAGGALGTLLLVGVGNLVPLQELIAGGGSGDGFDRWTWRPSRAIVPNITEFPFFTGLYADLHAHVVALPITVLAAALSYALAREPRLVALASSPGGRPAARIVIALRLGLLALVLGTLSATNAWDVPVYAALALVALLMAVRAVRGAWRRAATLAISAAVLAFSASLLFLPFYQHYVALFGSLVGVREPTPLGQVVSHLGGLLAIVVVGSMVALLPPGRCGVALLIHPVVVVTFVLGLAFVRGLFGSSRTAAAAALGAAMV